MNNSVLILKFRNMSDGVTFEILTQISQNAWKMQYMSNVTSNKIYSHCCKEMIDINIIQLVQAMKSESGAHLNDLGPIPTGIFNFILS